MNPVVNESKTKIPVTLFLILMFGLGLSACEGKDLSRAKAQSLIVASADFKQPAVISLISPAEKEPFGLNKSRDSEKAEEAKIRNLEMFLAYYPQIAVAVHLGLATVEQQLLKEEKAVGFQVPAKWFFTVRSRTGKESSSLWKEYGLPESDNLIPLARKEFINITGITSLAENQAQADFTWKWNPNKTALALQENTGEFKALPVDIQKGLLGQTEWNRRIQTENWNGERRGRALFQRFDDGWRLVSMTNF